MQVMNIHMNLFTNLALKSTKEKLERQQKAQSEIDFWEARKEQLKGKEYSSVEEIARKLEMYHNYNDAIQGIRHAYNHEQMFHISDEAKEKGEKIARAAQEHKPKTRRERELEERKKELLEEAEKYGDTEFLEKFLLELTEEEMDLLDEMSEKEGFCLGAMSEEELEQLKEELEKKLQEAAL